MSRMLRASAIMAAGTLVSRVTGFVRTMVLASAIGVTALGDAYNVAYNIPYVLLDLLLTGVLSSVVVPMIVRAQQQDADGGRAYEQRLISIAAVALAVVATIAVLAAPYLVGIYTTEWSEGDREVAVTLARFILPQIAFFGVGAIAGAILNTRDRFAAPMWAPVINNLVVIGLLFAYIAVSTARGDISKVTDTDLAILGLGTTAGIVAQAIVLIIALKRTGFSFRPRLDVWNAKLGEMGRMAVWTFGYIIIVQLGLLLTTNLATAASKIAASEGIEHGVGYTPYMLGFQLFQLPYGIIGVSVITAMLPRMSRAANEGRLDDIRSEFASGVRLISAVMVPASLMLMVLGPAITVPIYAHGATSVESAIYIGNVLQVFGLALVPFSIFQLLLRVFYSFGDTRTPVFVGTGTTACNVVISLVAFYTLPARYAVMGLAFAYAATYGIGAVAAWNMASRRVQGLGGWAVGSALTRMYLAALPTAVLSLATVWGVQQLFGGLSLINSLIILTVGVVLGGALYLFIAHRMRIPEVNSIVGLVAGRVGR